jgi:hypothetical protein
MEKKPLTHCMLEMDSMMDAIESCNHMKIQQLFQRNENDEFHLQDFL